MADSDIVEKNRRARQQRARLLKERRRHIAEAAENKSKKRVRKSGSDGSSKKPKMDMHDAELFVDRIKVSWLSYSGLLLPVQSQSTDCCCGTETIRGVPGQIRKVLADTAGRALCSATPESFGT